MPNHYNEFEILEWKHVREMVHNSNLELANIIDKISPSKDYPLIKASYSFGDFIISEGQTFMPYKGKHVALHSEEGLKLTKNYMSNISIPLFLVLKNSCEVFVNSNDRTIP